VLLARYSSPFASFSLRQPTFDFRRLTRPLPAPFLLQGTGPPLSLKLLVPSPLAAHIVLRPATTATGWPI
jgi:hypothetical protein